MKFGLTNIWASAIVAATLAASSAVAQDSPELLVNDYQPQPSDSSPGSADHILMFYYGFGLQAVYEPVESVQACHDYARAMVTDTDQGMWQGANAVCLKDLEVAKAFACSYDRCREMSGFQDELVEGDKPPVFTESATLKLSSLDGRDQVIMPRVMMETAKNGCLNFARAAAKAMPGNVKAVCFIQDKPLSTVDCGRYDFTRADTFCKVREISGP